MPETFALAGRLVPVMSGVKDMREKQQSSHVRLPQRSALVRGRVDKAGKVVEKPDERTVKQDPHTDLKKQPEATH
jgi:hypothetical protein